MDRPGQVEVSMLDDAASAGDPTDAHVEDRLDEQEDESFPASDPHSDWAGPPT